MSKLLTKPKNLIKKDSIGYSNNSGGRVATKTLQTKNSKRNSENGRKKIAIQHPRTIAVDTETTGLDLRHTCKPFIISTCTEEGVLRCWEWPVDPITRQPSIPSQERKEVRDYLEGAILVFHHAKFDVRAFSVIGIGFDFWLDDWSVLPDKNPKYPPLIIRCQTFHDTLLQSHACCSSDLHGLKELGVKYLRYSDSDEKALAAAVAAAARYCKSNGIEVSLGMELNGKRSTKSDYWLPKFVYDHILRTEGEVPEELQHFKDVCITYAGKDVERTILLHGVFQEVMEDINVFKGYEREKRLLQVVYRTEQEGITLNERKRSTKIKHLLKTRDEHSLICQKYADKLAKRPVNLRSADDLIEVIYKRMKMPVTKVTEKTSKPSTKAEIFADFYDLTKDPKGGHYNRQASAFFLNLILAKKNDKAATDLDNYKNYSLPHPKSKDYIVIYPSLNQSGTGTVRFSCSNPNGQNVSKVNLVEIGNDKEEHPGPRLRDVYSPPPGKIWYAIDYNQLELRVFATDSDEASLIQALDDGFDFHGFVSTQIFGKPIEKISKQERRIAKNTDFAIIFGAGEQKVNETAGIPGAYKMFAGLFPNVHSHMQKVITEVRKNGYVRTMDGYRLAIPNEPYKAVNYRVQGTAGSIIKNAMIAIDQEGLVDWIDSRIVLQIHDELIIEFTKDSPKHTPAAVYAVMRAMEQAGADLGINTPVSCERIESDWGHGEEVKVTKTKITPIKKAA